MSGPSNVERERPAAFTTTTPPVQETESKPTSQEARTRSSSSRSLKSLMRSVSKKNLGDVKQEIVLNPEAQRIQDIRNVL